MAFGINFVSGLVINCVVALGKRLSSLGGTLVHDLWQTDVELDKKQNEVVSKRWHNLLLYFTVLLYFLLAMLLFPHAFGNKLLYSNYIGL